MPGSPPLADESGDPSFLERLSPDERDALFAVGTRRRYPAGSTILFAGDPAHEVLIVLAGEVKAIVTAADGREVILSVVGKGALLGEVASLDGGDRSTTVQALDRVDVLAVGGSRFTEYLVAHPAVLRNLAMVIAGRLRDSDRRLLEFGTSDSLSRLCARLLELAKRYGVADDDGSIRIESPLSQGELASWSGLSREAVVKSMRSLRRLGWIRNEGRAITILDADSVRTRADL